jgi:hypothetical protein
VRHIPWLGITQVTFERTEYGWLCRLQYYRTNRGQARDMWRRVESSGHGGPLRALIAALRMRRADRVTFRPYRGYVSGRV